MSEKLEVRESDLSDEVILESDIFVLAAGFEDRALHLVSSRVFSDHCHCLIIRYDNGVTGNDDIFARYHKILIEKFAEDKIFVVDLESDKIEEFSSKINDAFKKFAPELKRISIDVSGMTSYAICLALKYARKVRPFEKQIVFYTSAAAYVPTFDEYERLIQNQSGGEIDYLPKSMALEMSENVAIEAFSGHRSGEGRTCLAIFAGYEVHRSSGTIDAINPSLLLLMYGVPGDDFLSWRLELSKKLHAKFEITRRSATEEVSTLHIQQSIDVLERYYNNLIDDYDLVIAPICSKMHSVATYLFWERFGEVQLSFPLPIGYNPTNRPTGVGKSYCLEIYEQRMLFRQAATE